MVAVRSIILIKFIPTVTTMAMVTHIVDSPATSTRLFGCYSLSYW
jgi:hypothetical protein